MAKTYIRVTNNGMLQGDLSDVVAERILKIRDVAVVPSFKNEIYDFPRWFREEARQKGLGAYEYARLTDKLSDYIGKLRDYQTVGAAFLFASPRSVLGDATGLGKTPQFCAMLNKIRRMNMIANRPTKRIIVAAETSAVGQLAVEIARFTGYKVTVLESYTVKMVKQIASFKITQDADGTKANKTIDFDVIVIKHSTLRSDAFYIWLSRVINEFDTFILDESAVVKNPDTAISAYVKILCDKMSRVHFLNATVFETHLLDVINQFRLCCPPLLPPDSWIKYKLCNYRKATYPIRGGHGALGIKYELESYKNQDAFRRALSLVYLTRSKKMVKASETERFYRAYIIKKTKAQKNAIRQGYRYLEVLNCPSLCSDINITNNPKDVPKLSRLVDLVQEQYEGLQIVVYAFHVEIQSAIKKYLEDVGRKVVILNGNTKNRDQVREDFNDGVYDVLVTNVKRSLNLHAGDVCIFYSVETNPASVEQIAGRIDRNVDDSSKTFVLLAYEGEEVDFFLDTVRQRSEDSGDLTDVVSETVKEFSEILSEVLSEGD